MCQGLSAFRVSARMLAHHGQAEMMTGDAGLIGRLLAAARATASWRASSMVAPAPPLTTSIASSPTETMQKFSLVTRSLEQS